MRRIGDGWYELVSPSFRLIAGIKREHTSRWRLYFLRAIGDHAPSISDERHTTRAECIASAEKRFAEGG